MKIKFLLFLALVSSGGIAVAAEVINGNAQPSQEQIYRNAKYGFEFNTPQGWAVRETNFYIAHYSDGFLTVNSQRPNLILSLGWGDSKPLSQQMQPGEVYISMGYSGGPGPETMRADTVGGDVQALLSTNRIFASYEAGLSHLDLHFFKRGKFWNISAWLRDPVTEENRQKVMSTLKSFRFIDAPVGNTAWAESLAWNELPEKIRGAGDWWRGWPVAGQTGEKSAFADSSSRSVSVTNSGSTYFVKFTLKRMGEWSYRITTDGKVESEPPIVHVAGPPPSQWPSDLPDTSKGAIDVSWIAPYVQASQAFGKTTITWFTKDGQVERHATVSDIQPGFVEIFGHPTMIQGINEDWQFSLPAGPTDVSLAGYITSTADSRVLFHERHPKQGLIALDIYIHGKLVNTAGPFFQYLGNDVAFNEDGSAGLLIFEHESRTNAQIVTLATNGSIRFRVDCGSPVTSLIVAPDGAGVLLRPNTGTNQNTFMWFTEKGELHSMDISPNPQCVGWIPQTCQSLFLTQLGFETTNVELIDWNVGKRLWDISLPGGGETLAIGLTPNLIIFSVAEPYPSGIWHKVNESLLQSGQEWVRTFYAVDVQDGKLVARWRGQFPHRYFDASRDHFLRLSHRLWYVTADEFTELNLEEITAKEHGWK
jgi:hypothetical protein